MRVSTGTVDHLVAHLNTQTAQNGGVHRNVELQLTAVHGVERATETFKLCLRQRNRASYSRNVTVLSRDDDFCELIGYPCSVTAAGVGANSFEQKHTFGGGGGATERHGELLLCFFAC